METTIVYTKLELANAVKSHKPLIKLEGEIKEEFLSKIPKSSMMATAFFSPLLIKSLTAIIIALLGYGTIDKIIKEKYNIEFKNGDIEIKFKEN